MKKFGYLLILFFTPIISAYTTSIVGGNEFPQDDNSAAFVVSLQSKIDRNKFIHFCGGSLIHNSWVLTAAHCVRYGAPYRVVISSYNINKPCIVRTINSAALVFIHPQYYGVTSGKDIALIKLPAPVYNVTPVNLSMLRFGHPFEKIGNDVTVIGWGRLDESNTNISFNLRFVSVPQVSMQDCKKSYTSVTNNHICAGYINGGKDSCQGDSGGPLFYNQSGKITQIGIVSYGKGCARPFFYGVYTRVSAYIDFIQNITGIKTFDAPITSNTNSCFKTTIFPTKKPTNIPTKKPTNIPTKKTTKKRPKRHAII